jgi:hypothetical protein
LNLQLAYFGQYPILNIYPGTNPDLPLDVVGQGTGRTLMVRKKIKFPSADVMGGLYLGVAVTGVEALVAMGLVIAFM